MSPEKWFTRSKPQHFNFGCVCANISTHSQELTNQSTSFFSIFWVNIFDTFSVSCRALIVVCPARLFQTNTKHLMASQKRAFQVKSRRKAKKWRNICPKKVVMLCALFSLHRIYRMVEHVAAKLKCYTNASNLYDVYVTGMFSFIDLVAAS